MVDNDDVISLVKTMNGLLRLIGQQAVSIAALTEYLTEQPSFDATRFGVLFRAQRASMTARLHKIEGASPSALLDFLQDFEGPTQ